jgi:hypothetical protein
VEAVGPSDEQADLRVHGLHAGVGQAERECVRDVDVALMDGAGEFDGGFELAAGGPRQPGVQQPHPFRAAGRDTFRNCSLSRYARYSRLVGGLDQRQLRLLPLGEVLRPLPQRVARILQLAGQGLHPCPAGVIPHLATHLIQCVPGPLHDVERVQTQCRVRGPLTNHCRDPLGSVGQDVGQRPAAFLPE